MVTKIGGDSVEGELQKRIRECMPGYFFETDGDNAISQAIDSAKKEFLMIFNDNKIPEEIDDLSDYMSDNALDIKDWFKKWFSNFNVQTMETDCDFSKNGKWRV